MPQDAKRSTGFTLVEMMMTLAIVAVLGAVALPGFGNLLGRLRQQAAVDDLQTALNQARIAAVSRGRHVVVCPTLDGVDCTHTTEWHHGWLLFADLDHDRLRSDGEPVIIAGQAQPAGIGIVASTGRLRVDYQPDGSASGTNLTLTVCSRTLGADGARTLVVNQVGRIRRGAATPAAAAACIAVVR